MATMTRQTGRRTIAERRPGVFFFALVPLLLFWMFGGVFAMTQNWPPPISGFIKAHRFFWFVTPPGVAIVFFPMLAILGRRAQRRAIEEIVACNGRMCLNCRYTLDQGCSAGTCPECGHHFDLSSLRRGWCRTYKELAYEVDWQQPQVAG